MKHCICGCERPIHARGYSTRCYARAYRAGLLQTREPVRRCRVPDCGRLAWAAGYCNTHYMRVLRRGDPLICKRDGRPRRTWVCSVEGCERPHYARGFCRSHYAKWLAHRKAAAIGAT
jgi:hypothetical protein